MQYRKLFFSGHATTQMFKRNISVNQVEVILKDGKIIKNYPDDKPFPSYLLLGFIEKRPLHIVISVDKSGNCYIITAYEPDIKIWEENFETKK